MGRIASARRRAAREFYGTRGAVLAPARERSTAHAGGAASVDNARVW